ncbi:hypothetical protein [Bacillus cihuensis]|uniref:hypothetical protein n=1 Tax=Bacillus cihuensis TaxID=1208599 RepID=UPI000405FAA1|nr:hypothetical protein [Bacillus cihuensis]
MAYNKYSNGGGLARFSTMEKKTSSYNSNFDTFTRNVDTLHALEIGSLRDFVGLGLIEATNKVGTKISVASTIKIAGKFANGVPLLSLASTLIQYVWYYDKANKAWWKIPGIYYYW